MANFGVLLLAVISVALPGASESNELYDPPWSAAKPIRLISFEYDRDSGPQENGERLYAALMTLSPGDHLSIEGGTYSIARRTDLAISGTEAAPIRVSARKGAEVKITRPDPRQNILNIGQSKPAEYLVLQGLEFTGGSHGLRIGTGNNIWIDRCHIHHTGEVCLSANSADTHHLYLTRNEIHDGGGTAEGMYLGGNHGKVIMSESVIALNHVYNCRGTQGDGIEVKQGSWGNLIARNKVHDCNYPCITVYGTGGKRQNVIERNLCFRSRDNVMQVQGEAIVRNNILVAGGNSAFASTDHQGKTRNLQVVHNTLVNSGHAFRGNSWNGRSGMLLANNVIYSKNGNALHFPSGSGGVVIEGNVVWGGGVGYASVVGNGIQDFRDVSWDGRSTDATPSKDAPFDAGVERYKPKGDYNGDPRKPGQTICGAILRATSR